MIALCEIEHESLSAEWSLLTALWGERTKPWTYEHTAVYKNTHIAFSQWHWDRYMYTKENTSTRVEVGRRVYFGKCRTPLQPVLPQVS